MPTDDRNVHYLGREYFFRGRWQDAIDTLKKHLSLPSATWKDERAASMRYLAGCYFRLGNEREGEVWTYRAIAEAEKALSFSPSDERIRNNRDLIARSLGQDGVK